ncbi:demethoxyubiquinone hydroxylase family protein [Sphingomonas sp. BK069]|uniref:demethoxyubiquinone hydroxylase family protein n=1 Tax=Sphingomonas sp. BK069 TaxID=2586979 RepID=UPI00184F102E|nr:demethoxyubiquinone hydroxylase family protein [Sphingomonas sp. BK069]MBB3349713.1 ubiquinone biosynthesis monooxygenase Coq7 [Sphingomonas sp. BK069]
MIRVDHAGEFGAVRIYDGQIAVLGRDGRYGTDLLHMRAQEREHHARFSELLTDRNVRPTILLPLWHAAGFALGVTTALMSPEAAMACTEAVEDTVVQHYDDQLASLGANEPDLSAIVQRIRDEELEHRDQAVEAGSHHAPGHAFLYGAIRLGCRIAIAISKRI